MSIIENVPIEILDLIFTFVFKDTGIDDIEKDITNSRLTCQTITTLPIVVRYWRLYIAHFKYKKWLKHAYTHTHHYVIMGDPLNHRLDLYPLKPPYPDYNPYLFSNNTVCEAQKLSKRIKKSLNDTYQKDVPFIGIAFKKSNNSFYLYEYYITDPILHKNFTFKEIGQEEYHKRIIQVQVDVNDILSQLCEEGKDRHIIRSTVKKIKWPKTLSLCVICAEYSAIILPKESTAREFLSDIRKDEMAPGFCKGKCYKLVMKKLQKHKRK